MADSLRPLQLDDEDDEEDLPPPIPDSILRSSTPDAHISSQEIIKDHASSQPKRRPKSNSWSAPPTLPPPLPAAPPAALVMASLPASKLLQKSLEALNEGRRAVADPSDADNAFSQLVVAATEAKLGVGMRISGAQPVTCTGTIEGHSAARHPLSAKFMGSKIVSVDGVAVESKTQDQVRDLVLGPFGSTCRVQFVDAKGVSFSADLLRTNPEFFTSYEEQVRRLGSMMTPALSSALQAQNAALQQRVKQLCAQLQEADDKVEHCVRALESAQMNVQVQEESTALSRIIEEEEIRDEISELEARVQQLTREVALKDSVIRKHELLLNSNTEAALKADLAKLSSKCAELEKQNLEAAAALNALKEESAAKQRASTAPQNNAVPPTVMNEILKTIAMFEERVPKLTAHIARLEVELQTEKRLAGSRQAELEDVLARELSCNDRLQQLEEQLQRATSRSLQNLTANRIPRRDSDTVIDFFIDSGNDAWDAAVQRHAVALVVSSVVERTIAKARERSVLGLQHLAARRPRPTAAVITHDAASQSGCSADEVGSLTATVAHDFSKCLDHIAQAVGLSLPPNLCTTAVAALLQALLTNNCSALTLSDVEAWCQQAADKTRSFELRAIATEGERDGLLHFREQLEKENSRLVLLHQKQQQRHKEVESAMLASVNDVQQLSQQMSSLLAIIKDKSAENNDLLRQNTRLKQLATIQTDLRLQVEGQRQQLLQYQVLERESLQLKMSRDDAVQRLEQIEHDLLTSKDAQRQTEDELFKVRELLMEAELRLFSMSEDKARLRAERDSAEATLLAFNFLRSGGNIAVKRLPLSPSNLQLAPLPANVEFLAVDMKDSSAIALQQAQDLFESLSSVAACSQLFSSALDLCERCIMNASEQGLRMSNELRTLTDDSNSLSDGQPADVFVQQLEANADRAVLTSERMNQLIAAMKAQHKDLTSRYSAFVSQFTVFEHAVAEADKGSKHLQVPDCSDSASSFVSRVFQWLVKRRLMLHKEGRQPPSLDGA